MSAEPALCLFAIVCWLLLWTADGSDARRVCDCLPLIVIDYTACIALFVDGRMLPARAVTRFVDANVARTPTNRSDRG